MKRLNCDIKMTIARSRRISTAFVILPRNIQKGGEGFEPKTASYKGVDIPLAQGSHPRAEVT